MQSTSTLDSPDGMGMLPQEAHGAEPSGRRMSITDPPVTWAEKVPTAGVKSVSREVVKVAMVASVIVRWRHCPTRTDPHVHMRIGRHNDKGPRGAGLVVSILTGRGSERDAGGVCSPPPRPVPMHEYIIITGKCQAQHVARAEYQHRS